MNQNSLNVRQQEAIHAIQGPISIYAGAGSGKTMVITNRISHMIKEGIPPSSILAVTFTNKAAREMRERVEKLAGFHSKSLLITTFHSACARFLRLYATSIGYKDNYSIFAEKESRSTLKDIIKRTDTSHLLTPATLSSHIDKFKNIGWTPDILAKKIKEEAPIPGEVYSYKYGERQVFEIIQKCYALYQEELKAQNAMDFGDLILNTVLMLEQKPEILSFLQNRFKYFLIDEFQDTNPIQFRFIQLMASHTENICIVGDDDQSIYSWRGANPSFILNFKDHYVNAQVIKLEQNYRSSRNIIEAASALIQTNQKRVDKKLWTDHESGNLITTKAFSSNREEAQFVAQTILEELQDKKSLSDFAILYRTNAQSRLLEDELRKKMIPYVIYGSIRFYERAEIKILMGILQLLVNVHDNQCFIRAISNPKRGVGKKSLEKLEEISKKHNLSMLKTAVKIARNELDENLGRSNKGLTQFSNDFLTWLGKLRNEVSCSMVLDKIIRDIDFKLFIEKTWPEESNERWLNVQELKNALQEFETQSDVQGYIENTDITADENKYIKREDILSSFIQNAMLIIEPKYSDVVNNSEEAVSLMTVHASKGLEFENVFIAGLEEQVFPHKNSSFSEDEIEEERRLMYVAMTRAKKKLYLLRARYNPQQGIIKEPSRFLFEIPQQYTERVHEHSNDATFSNELTYVYEEDYF